jgi:2-methylisocitrate lyase-like PEP mutase family enzyme
LERNLAITRDIVQAVSVPVMADGEDGFGGPLEVSSTVSAFIEAGVAGINIEDQVLPPGKARAVVEPSLMIEKLEAARAAAARANAADLVINGRTDVLAVRATRSEGIAEAVERGNQYLKAGADLVFVTGVRTPDEARELVAGIRGSVSIAAGLAYNAKTLPMAALRDCGVARISLPVVAVMAALKAVKKTLSILHATASLDAVLDEGLLCTQQDVEDIFTAKNAKEANE